MRVGSLFSGIGGIDMCFQNAGFDIVWGVEIDKKACEVYKANFNNAIINKDLRSVDLNKLSTIDILCAGFPCQAFSIAGYQKGFNDERGKLFFEIIRYVKHFKPKVVFLENVKNLKTHNKGDTLNIIISELNALGYYVKYDILNACDYGIPQNRERIYIVAFLDEDAYKCFSFPKPIPLTKKVRDFLGKGVISNAFYYNKESSIFDKLKVSVTSKDSVYQWRRSYVRENKSNLCPTLTANMGTGGHNVPIIKDDFGIRKLTPRECLNLQGFPKEFRLADLSNSVLYRLVGNSVCVPIIKSIATQITKAVEASNE